MKKIGMILTVLFLCFFSVAFAQEAVLSEPSLAEQMSFFAVLIPAALADSINPCAFAVMLLLLGAILSKTQKKSKVILAGMLFSLAVFISYLAMGIGLFSALASAENTFVIKLIVGIL